MNREETLLTDRLRRRIVGRLHVGLVQTGDRLPSIRQVARESGLDHRVVARVYRALEAERLVDIRPGSGVYVAAQEWLEGAVLTETAAWLAGILTDGWERRMSPAEVAELVRRAACAELRCACVESTTDHMVALAAELEEDFDFEVAPVDLGAGPPEERVWESSEARSADLIVTTSFHAEPVRRAAERLETPAVVATVNPALTDEIDRILREAPITAVVADPRFGDRARTFFRETAHEGRIRIILAEDLESPAELDRDERVLITRAARRRLGMDEYHLLPPPFIFISAESARELADVRVRVGLAKATG